MDFTPEPSTLERMALIQIAASLWNHPDIRLLITEYTNSPIFSRLNDDQIVIQVPGVRRDRWQINVENRVLEKVPHLPLPKPIKEQVLYYIQPVGFEILRWMKYHIKCCHLNLDLPNRFCWTANATIDRKRMAELLVQNSNILITTRYELGCIYCLEDYVSQLWYDMPNDLKEHLFVEDPSKVYQRELMIFWGCLIERESTKVDSIIQSHLDQNCSLFSYLFRTAVKSGNRVAAASFLQKLKRSEEPLVELALYVAEARSDCDTARREPHFTNPPKEYFTDMLCFLLSYLNNEEQMEVFKTYPFKVLLCFLDWPWQSFFVKMASCVWEFLSVRDYHTVLRNIVTKQMFGYRDYNYRGAFQDVWLQIPYRDKKYIMNNRSIAWLLDSILQIQDEEIFKLIFQNETLMETNRLLFINGGRDLCRTMISNDNWNLLKYFVKLLISSKEEMMKFKAEFEKYVQTREGWIRIDKYEKLFPFLDDLVHEYDKRENAEGDGSAAKRLCNIK